MLTPFIKGLAVVLVIVGTAVVVLINMNKPKE